MAQIAALEANSSAVCEMRANQLLPCCVRLVAWASGESWNTLAGLVTSTIAWVSALVEPPIIAMTSSDEIMRAVAWAALLGLPAESSLMISIEIEPIVPSFLSCSSANCAPARDSVPYTAAAPDNGPTMPTLTVCAGAAPAIKMAMAPASPVRSIFFKSIKLVIRISVGFPDLDCNGVD